MMFMNGMAKLNAAGNMKMLWEVPANREGF